MQPIRAAYAVAQNFQVRPLRKGVKRKSFVRSIAG
jgi:hypothetical protein